MTQDLEDLGSPARVLLIPKPKPCGSIRAARQDSLAIVAEGHSPDHLGLTIGGLILIDLIMLQLGQGVWCAAAAPKVIPAKAARALSHAFACHYHLNVA
jgi:hypothetical protein